MTNKDMYYNRAKQEGYRTRSAYKLQQLDEAADLFDRGDVVVDLGAAPGGWLQVAAETVGDAGTVVGVDRQRIDALDADAVETVRGDLTEERTRDRLRDAIEGRPVDVVVSDMAPNVTGEYELDHARSVHLARTALETATDLLAPGGDFVAKVFEGRDTDALRADIDDGFEYVRTTSPDASREESSELYLIGKGRIDAPVAVGETRSVEVVDEGDEGDGIARIDGYAVFVPGAAAGDRVQVRIETVKPRYAFAERVGPAED